MAVAGPGLLLGLYTARPDCSGRLVRRHPPLGPCSQPSVVDGRAGRLRPPGGGAMFLDRAPPVADVGAPPWSASSGTASTSERATTPGQGCPRGRSPDRAGRYFQPVSGADGRPQGAHARTHPGPPTYSETPATRPTLRTHYQPFAAKAQHETERPRVEGHRDGPLAARGSCCCDPMALLSPVVRPAGSAAAQLANMVQLG